MPSTNDYHVNAQFKMGGGESVASRTVAPATARMMGNKQQQTPLMPPVEISDTSDEQNIPPPQQQSHKNGKSHPMEPKQFHRKSLGDWDFLETVGAGSMGKVKLAKHHYTNEICAIKIVNRATKSFLHKEQSLPPPQNEQEILERQKKLEKEISRDKRTIREASLGQVLYHPHICRLFEMCTMSNHFYMLFEYVSGGQLLDYIIQHGSLREHHARKFARGIASALQYLHANNIVHRDLKIENIMISTSGEIKIIDFGLSNLFDNRKQLHTFCGSLYFAAPELLKASPYMGPEVDVWSFGVVLYVLVCGKVPFDDENSSVLHEKIKQGKVEYPQHLSIEVISLLSKMLVVEPKRRATLKQVVEHHWMVRGFDFPPPSYVPNRIPLTSEMLDITVVKEMFRLEFIDDIDESMKFLDKIITEEAYIQLSKQYWVLLQNSNVHSISTNSDLNGTTSNDLTKLNNGGSSYDKIHRNSFEDPTRAYHPLLSIYYLVDEMLRRKLAKLQRKQQQQQQSAVLPQKQVQKLEQPIELPSNQGTASPILETVLPSVATNNKASPIESGNAMLPPPIPASIPSVKQRPLQILVPPKLAIPEQAHTSPTTRKSSDAQKDPEYVLSPLPQTNDYQQRSTSPISLDTSEKPKFGSLFRRLSQRRSQQQQHEQQNQTQSQQKAHIQQLQQQRPQIQISPDDSGRLPKMHSRAVSECTPASVKLPAYGLSAHNGSNTQNIPSTPMRSASQKQNAELPALPLNAESLVQQQRERHLEQDMERLGIAGKNSSAGRNDSNPGVVLLPPQDESKPLPLLNVAKGRKLHPSARAKSVGHARRESLKFMRPPVPTSVSPGDYEENGFLEYSDDNKSYNANSNNPANAANNVSQSVGTHSGNADLVTTVNTKSTDEELTDDQILEEASKAPAGSMPSIDYPRSLFLKGFFSVQTTSSKPLPIVRYKIIFVLNKMHIEFKEVKGGFVCVQRPMRDIAENLPLSEATAQQHLQPPKAMEAAAAIHRRTGSRHGSLRRQGPSEHSQSGMPSTPAAANIHNHERNLSMISSPLPHNISEELSSASLESMRQDDILTTSRAQDMNKVENEEITNSREKPPIKFEIHIVKVRIVGLAGVHFKKVSGNTWMYKELASEILKQLNL